MSLTWRPYGLPDVEAVTALANAARAADGTGRPLAEHHVAEQLEGPRFDPTTDTVSAWEGDTLVAAGSVWGPAEPVDGAALGVFDGDVHPDHRGRGIGTELLRRLQERAAALAAQRHPGLPVRLRTPGGTPGSGTARLLEQAGFSAAAWFVWMEVDTAAWTDPGTPSAAVPLDGETLRLARDAHNDAFRDHRSSSPVPEDVWQHWTSGSTARHDLGRVVVEDGEVLAYALVSCYQPDVAHVDLVGTRRRARGRGMARAVLLGTLRAARDAGIDVVELEVDSTSPTGADRLYASLGFRPVRTISRHQRDVA